MQTIESIIQSKLLANGLVILPTLGKFYLHDFTGSSNKFTKDTRIHGSTIHFEYDTNIAILNDDNTNELQLFAEQIVKTMQTAKSCSALPLGHFFKNSLGDITFLASPKLNLSHKTFGLSQFRINQEESSWKDMLNTLKTIDININLDNDVNEIENNEKETSLASTILNEVKDVVKVNNTIPEPIKPIALDAAEVVNEETVIPVEVFNNTIPLTIKVETENKILNKEELKVVEKEIGEKFKTEILEETLDVNPKTEEIVYEKSNSSKFFFKIALSILILTIAGTIIFQSKNLIYNKVKRLANLVDEKGNLPVEINTKSEKESDVKNAIENSMEESSYKFLEEQNRKNEEKILELSFRKGDYFVVAGTFSSKSIALGQCKRWQNLGMSAAAIKPINQNEFNIIISRFDTKEKAKLFAKQVPALDSFPLEVQTLKIQFKK